MDAVEFIDDFLQHKTDYDPGAAHEYYMRTRKLKGRKKHGFHVPSFHNPFSTETKVRDHREPMFKSNNPGQSHDYATQAQAKRVQAALDRLDRAHEASKKLPEKHRNEIQKHLNGIRKKLHGIHNPFGSKTHDRSPKPGTFDNKVHSVKTRN